MKLCADCLHCRKESGWECHAPQNTTYWVNPVNGHTSTYFNSRYCHSQREHGWLWSRLFGQRCGLEGRWYAPDTLGEANQVSHRTKDAALETLQEITTTHVRRLG